MKMNIVNIVCLVLLLGARHIMYIGFCWQNGIFSTKSWKKLRMTFFWVINPKYGWLEMSAEYMASYGIRSSKSWHNTKIVEKHLPKPGIVQRTFAIWALRVLDQGPSDLQSDAFPTELFRLMNCIDCTTLCSTMRFKFCVFRYVKLSLKIYPYAASQWSIVLFEIRLFLPFVCVIVIFKLCRKLQWVQQWCYIINV